MTRDGILILDAEDAVVLDTNPFLTQLLGCGRDDLVGRSLQSADVLTDRAQRVGLLEEVMRHGYAYRRGLATTTRDGRRLLLDVVGNSYLVDDRTVIQLNVSDVTDRAADADRAAGPRAG